MDPRTKHGLRWGLVGLLSFLVLIQGFQLLTERSVDLVVTGAMALVVGVGATALTYWAQERLPETEPGTETDEETERQ